MSVETRSLSFSFVACILAAFMEEGMVFCCKKEKTDSSCFLFHISHFPLIIIPVDGGKGVRAHGYALVFFIFFKRIYIYSWRLLPVRKKANTPRDI